LCATRSDVMCGTIHPMAKSDTRALTRVPAVGTRVVHIPTGREGVVTSDAGYMDGAPVANVLWDGAPFENTVRVRVLRLAEQAAAS
jgi:hypothetical protein